MGCAIDFNLKCLITKQGLILPMKINDKSGSVCRVSLHENVQIPQRSEKVITGRIDTDNGSNCIGLVEPLRELLCDYPIHVARTLVEPKRSVVPVHVVNTTNQTVKIDKNSAIATFQNVSIEHDEPKIEAKSVIFPDSLQDLFDRSKTHLSEEQSIILAEFLAKNQNIFSLQGELGCTDLLYHHINTGDAQPIKIPPRRMSPSDREEAQKQINEMLELGIIQPSKSAWCAPIVLVRKKDKTKRFCIDYRKLNSATVKDAYPLPRIDDTLDTLSGSKWFSCLYLTSSYWQIKVAQEDRPKTAFSIGSGLHEFRVMPFGLAIA